MVNVCFRLFKTNWDVCLLFYLSLIVHYVLNHVSMDMKVF